MQPDHLSNLRIAVRIVTEDMTRGADAPGIALRLPAAPENASRHGCAFRSIPLSPERKGRCAGGRHDPASRAASGKAVVVRTASSAKAEFTLRNLMLAVRSS